jgi:cell division protein FtsQ
VGLAAVIFLLVCAKVNRERTQVSGIEVKIDELQDNFFVTKDFVKKLVSDRFDFQNKMMTGKILKKIEQTVEVVPQVKNAIAYVDDNGVLKIEVEQRTPVARVFALNGESFYVDENGDKFPLSPVFSAKAPVITGNIQEDCKKTEKIQSKNLQDAFDVVMQLAQNTIWQSMIGQINVNDKNEIELIPRLGSAIVLLGKPENLAAKMKKLCVFYAEVIGREGWDKYKVINIMYKDQVVCLK